MTPSQSAAAAPIRPLRTLVVATLAVAALVVGTSALPDAGGPAPGARQGAVAP